MSKVVEIVRRFRIITEDGALELDVDEAWDLYHALTAYLYPEHETVLFTNCSLPPDPDKFRN